MMYNQYDSTFELHGQSGGSLGDPKQDTLGLQEHQSWGETEGRPELASACIPFEWGIDVVAIVGPRL